MKKLRVLRLVCLMLVCSLLAGCQKPAAEVKQEPTAGVTILPTYTPTPIVYKEPQYTDVAGEAYGLHPALSGAYEAIWDTCSPIPMDTVIRGSGDSIAEYRLLWDAKTLYIQVHVTDTEPDTSSDNYLRRDGVIFYLNESATKPKVYGIGDAFYNVDRDNKVTYGPGCDMENFKSVVYEVDGGYYVEAAIPLLTISAASGTVIGFDVRANLCRDGRQKYVLAWSDNSGHADVNLHGVGLLTLE